VGAYRCLASAFAHLGRDEEAREAAAHLLELDPAGTTSALIARKAPHSVNRDATLFTYLHADAFGTSSLESLVLTAETFELSSDMAIFPSFA
jgi:hypothetical protein